MERIINRVPFRHPRIPLRIFTVNTYRLNRCKTKRTILYVSKTIEAVQDGQSTPRRLKNINNDIHFPAYKSAL